MIVTPAGILTTSAGGNGRCTALPVDTWETERRAPRFEDRCPNPETHYVRVLVPNGSEELMRLCDEHTDEARRMHGFAWARPLTKGAGAMADFDPTFEARVTNAMRLCDEAMHELRAALGGVISGDLPTDRQVVTVWHMYRQIYEACRAASMSRYTEERAEQIDGTTTTDAVTVAEDVAEQVPGSGFATLPA